MVQEMEQIGSVQIQKRKELKLSLAKFGLTGTLTGKAVEQMAAVHEAIEKRFGKGYLFIMNRYVNDPGFRVQVLSLIESMKKEGKIPAPLMNESPELIYAVSAHARKLTIPKKKLYLQKTADIAIKGGIHTAKTATHSYTKLIDTLLNQILQYATLGSGVRVPEFSPAITKRPTLPGQSQVTNQGMVGNMMQNLPNLRTQFNMLKKKNPLKKESTSP